MPRPRGRLHRAGSGALTGPGPKRDHRATPTKGDAVDWHELEKKKVSELREMAKEHAGLEGATGMHKDELVAVVAKELGIERPHLVAEGIDKTEIKKKIKVLRSEVADAIAAKNKGLIHKKRRQIHRLKRKIHRAAHLTH